MKTVILRGIFFMFLMFWLVITITSTTNAALDSTGHTLTGANISGGNQGTYTVSFAFSGTMSTGDVTTIKLIGSWWTTLTWIYTGAWGETGASIIFNATTLSDWSVTLSGKVLSASGVLITGTNLTATITKDTTAPTGTIAYNYTGTTSAPVTATITLSESGTITNNGGSWNYTFSSNGSFVFTFVDTLGNTGTATATVSNIVYLPGWTTYMPPTGGSTNNIDNCPNWDHSSSSYDRICDYAGTPSVVTTGTTTVEVDTSIDVPTGPYVRGSIEGSPYNSELNQAYLYAYSLAITTIPTILDANIKGHLTRAQMAKMIWRYAIWVLGQVPNDTKECTFSDISDQSSDLQSYITVACQLDIMRGNMSSFNPNGIVTRAEFGTVLSRALYGTTYETWSPYYVNHLQALLRAGIITNTDPSIIELRWHVMLMLMRATQQ